MWAEGSTKPALEQKLAFQEATRAWGLRWEEVPLNATRRDYVFTRPVLMLAGCERCRAMRSKRRAEAGEAPPPACMTPWLERGAGAAPSR